MWFQIQSNYIIRYSLSEFLKLKFFHCYIFTFLIDLFISSLSNFITQCPKIVKLNDWVGGGGGYV